MYLYGTKGVPHDPKRGNFLYCINVCSIFCQTLLFSPLNVTVYHTANVNPLMPFLPLSFDFFLLKDSFLEVPTDWAQHFWLVTCHYLYVENLLWRVSHCDVTSAHPFCLPCYLLSRLLSSCSSYHSPPLFIWHIWQVMLLWNFTVKTVGTPFVCIGSLKIIPGKDFCNLV